VKRPPTGGGVIIETRNKETKKERRKNEGKKEKKKERKIDRNKQTNTQRNKEKHKERKRERKKKEKVRNKENIPFTIIVIGSMDTDDIYLPFHTYGSCSLNLYIVWLAYMGRLKPAKVSHFIHPESPHISSNYLKK
jgi:hypothetical protein